MLSIWKQYISHLPNDINKDLSAFSGTQKRKDSPDDTGCLSSSAIFYLHDPRNPMMLKTLHEYSLW